MMEPFETLSLDNGLHLDFIDRSNRYFGDYHRVRIEVRIDFELPQEGPPGGDFWRQARLVLGERLTLTRQLERMAVAAAEVAAVRQRLVEDFLCTTGTYLRHSDYQRALVAAELNRRRPGRIYAP